MKRTIIDSEALPRVLFIIFVLAATIPVILALVYSSEYDFLYVPFASWFVFGLSGLILTLDGMAFYFWRQFRRERERSVKTAQDLAAAREELVETARDLTAMREELVETAKDLTATREELVETAKDLAVARDHLAKLDEHIPAICGHKHLDKAEFLAIIQILFRRPPDIQYIRVKPLPGGYGGSTTMLAELQRRQSNTPLPRSSVIKLGYRREMADEHDKFQKHVWKTLDGAPHLFKYAEWGDSAGIAYEFAGLALDHEIQSFYQFYRGYAALEVSELIEEIYSPLSRAWYQNGQIDRVDLYHEYSLLSKKQTPIIEQVERIVDEDDRYRRNFTVAKEELQHNLKPNFCPEMDILWRDPVAFLRTWPKQNLMVTIHRSVVHGDLHARNILVEIGRHGQKHVWFIDFSHTGNGLSGERTHEAIQEGIPINPDKGHTLRDFCRLEVDVKFILTRLQDEDDLRLAVAFERELMTCKPTLNDRPVTLPPIEALTDERFKKAWQVIREIRRQAAKYLINEDDLRPYYLSLLHATLPIVYYHPEQFESEVCERQQKRYALISAGMLCSQL